MYEVFSFKNKKWENIIKENNLDIYFSPYYLKIWEDYGDGKTQAFLYENSVGKVLYPYFIREINFGNINKTFFDISTSYGYGGPILLECKKNNVPLLVKEFRNEFNEYAYQKDIISEFIRFHPIYKNYKYFINSDIECKFLRNTVEINLLKEPEEILMSMKATTRNEVHQALRNKLNIQFYLKPSIENIRKFNRIYLTTMKRLEASEYYEFNLEYFINTFDLLEENAEIAFVFYEGNIISSSIFLLSDNLVHYHLSGSLSEYKSYRPNNLMLYKAALRYKAMGKKYFHLGGGHRGNDSLFKFKKGFNKNGTLDFYVGTKINNKDIYNDLVKEWKIKNKLEEDFKSDYFPLYRCKL